MDQILTTKNHRYKGDVVQYSIMDSQMGRLLVASTAVGLCLTEMDDTDAPMLDYLHQRFRHSVIAEDDGRFALAQWAAEFRDYTDSVGSTLRTSLDVRGTEFQIAVWRHLTDIPLGRTTTYGRIANTLGRPKASRAVGAAVGHNPIAIHIPCHRVIGQNGKLTGFRWGLGRKERILIREGVL